MSNITNARKRFKTQNYNARLNNIPYIRNLTDNRQIHVIDDKQNSSNNVQQLNDNIIESAQSLDVSVIRYPVDKFSDLILKFHNTTNL